MRVDERSTYELLIQELPDPNRDLFYQVIGTGAKRFRCFNKLPIEIRLKIWKACLPGPRHVLLDFPKSGDEERLPTAIFANRESHQEILRGFKYTLSPHWPTWVGYPLFLDPVIDTLCLPSRASFDEVRLDENAWYQLLSKTPPHFLESVKILDIVDVNCLHRLGRSLRLMSSGGDIDFLRFFTGLEEVGISPNTTYDDTSLPDTFET